MAITIGSRYRQALGPCVARFLLPLAPIFLGTLCACTGGDTPTQIAKLGVPETIEAVFADVATKGVIEFQKVTAANWSVPLSGLLNLDHPKARAADLKNRDEAIDIYLFVLRHPVHGTFFVDSGVAETFRTDDGQDQFSWLLRRVMNLDQLVLRQSNRQVMADLAASPVDGVFLTHAHHDHILGLGDLPPSTPVYIGPGELQERLLINAATRATTNRLLGGFTLREWDFAKSKAIDVFGDGSLFALHAPGHTAGLTIYLARTTTGTQLMLGDLTHTRWGWANAVEPGSFSSDMPGSAASLKWVKSLLAKYDPAGKHIVVHPGHQSLD